MILTGIRLKDFRCYREIHLSNFERLVIFIGENDAGKTVLLEAINLLIGDSPCTVEDLHKLPDGTHSEECIIEGFFQLEEFDTLPGEFRSGADSMTLHMWRVFSMSKGSQIFYTGLGYEDTRFDSFSGATFQKDLLNEYGISPASNDAGRKSQRDELRESGRLRLVKRQLQLPSFSPLAAHLPRVECVSSSAYRHPDTMIQQTLRSVASRIIKPFNIATGIAEELTDFVEVRHKIKTEVDREISSAKATLQKIQPKLVDVRIDPLIDFTKSVSSGALTVDLGDGERALSSFGEGTKKKLWMGFMEWESQNAMKNRSGSVIRLYDEPDVNLHYAAQRQLFNNITDLSANQELRTQCFVCTHSMTLIDRAPSSAINLITVSDDNKRHLNRIQSCDSTAEVTTFLGEVGRAVGLTNTVLLFERGFLIVEGESEEVTLPYFYQLLFGTSMAADGIVLIPLHGCGAWKSVIKVLLNNRIDLTHLLLDSDCQLTESKLRLTPESLAEAGVGEEFLRDQVTFIGNKEFEDSFDSTLIVDALNDDFPLEGGQRWEVEEIEQLKTCSNQFAKDLIDQMKRKCEKSRRTDVTKPNFAWAVSQKCSEGTIPDKIREALLSLRRRASIQRGLSQNAKNISH